MAVRKKSEQKTLENIEAKEKVLMEEVDKIEEAQDNIEKEEKEILRSEKRVSSYLVDSGLSVRRLNFFRLVFSNRISKHKLLFALLLTLAIVLIWRGFWLAIDSVPILSNWPVSIVVGAFIVWLLRRYTALP